MKKHVKKLSKIKIALLAIVLLLGGFWIVKSMMVSPQVALIANGGDQPVSCVSNIGTFTASDSCGQGMVNRVDYTCLNSDKKGYEGGSAGDCIDTYSAYVRATGYCGQTCTTPTATPQPSCVPNPCPADGRACKLAALPPGQSYCPIGTSVPAPSLLPSPTPYPTLAPPSPTSTPSASVISCRPRIFKLNANDNPKSNPMLYATSDREINPSSQRVKEGEYYAFLVEATSFQTMTVATVSASTQNLHGFNEPIEYQVAADFCRIEAQSKYLSCFKGPYQLKANVPALLPVGGTFRVTSDIARTANTSITIKPYYITGSSSWDSKPCTYMMLAAESVETAPTSTPVPTPAPGCYVEQRFCLQGLVGGKCPAATICPSATPTPTPIPSPVYSTAPSLTPAPTSCGSNLNKWQFKESCGTNMYRYVEYRCTGSTASQTQGSSSSCKSESTWVTEARNACMKTQCASPSPSPVVTSTPTPVATLAPRSVTKQTLRQCYNTCRANKMGRVSCVSYCLR